MFQRISNSMKVVWFSFAVAVSLMSGIVAADSRKPNIIYIMADDMGYGDASPFGLERSRIPTPGIEQLARQGMRFTNAHTVASVCVPSRIAIMTGRYPWRVQGARQNGPWGFLNPRIPTDHFTLGKMLRSAGYTTGYVGKWHLGTKMQTTDGKNQGLTNVDYTKPLTVSPIDYGFDYSFILPGSLDMFPYVFARNGQFVGKVNKQRGWSAFNRIGPTEENFEDYKVLDTFATEVEQFIARQAASVKKGTPFFLYLALTSPHTPVSPHPKFQGATKLGIYGDFVYESDHCVVRTLRSLKQHGIDENTMVIFTSDHGPAAYAGLVAKATYNNVKSIEKLGHFPSGPFRGYKFSIYEGGLRVPYAVRWPAVVKPGTSSDSLIGLHDLLATVAEVTGTDLAADQGVDSISFLNLLHDPSSAGDRKSMLMSSPWSFTITRGDWKLCLCPGSGAQGAYGNLPKWDESWKRAVEKFGKKPKRNELLKAEFVQLFNLDKDPTESKNLAAEYPELVAELFAEMTRDWQSGRSTPGPKQENDRPRINYWARVPKSLLQSP